MMFQIVMCLRIKCITGYLSFGPIEKIVFCDLGVHDKDGRSRMRGAQAM
jgi:hypothetical protein